MVVGCAQGIEQFGHQALGLRQCELFARLKSLRQFTATDELHDDVRHITVLTKVEQGDDVGMMQPRRSLCLALETARVIAGCRIVCHDAAQHGLDGHRAAQSAVHALVDHAHGTTAQHAHQLVAPQGSANQSNGV